MNVHFLRDGTATLGPPGLRPGGAALRLPNQRVRWRLISAVAVVAAITTSLAADRSLRRTMIESTPSVLPPASGLFAPPVPATITVSAGGQRAPWATTHAEVRGSVELWKRMHLEDWNGVAVPLQEVGLDNLLRRYSQLLNNPTAWDRMSVFDWDAVPQPIRWVAYRRMVAYWSGFYDVGGEFDLPPWLVSNTLSAIVISESWLDHRARSMNRDGTWDIGLAQASAYARERIRQLHVSGVVDVSLTEADYDNPWMATRFVAMWMTLMLQESGGDLDRAVRAYNRGSGDAMDALGADYLAVVQRRLSRYVLNVAAPSSWDFVWRRSRQIIAEQSADKPWQ